MFSLIDWLVIVAYFMIVAGIGVFFSRRNANFSDFMFGGGNMPWLAVGISLIATSVSANTFLGNPADGYANDMRLLMLNVGSLIAIVIVGTVFIPRFRASGVKSAYELLERKFSRPVRVLAAVFYSCHLLLRMGMLIYGPSLVLMKITGAPFYVAAIAMAVFAMLYTSLGGIKAVTTTDIIQFVIFFGGGLLCIWFCAKGVGGFAKTWALASEAGKTRWYDFTWNPASDRNFWTASLVYVVFEVAIRGCDQQFVQRYLSTKSVRTANYSSITSSLLGVCVGVVFFTVGAFMYVYFQVAHVEPLPALKVNEVLPHFIVNVLPTGVKGLLVAAILAADMGALSSVLTALSNTTVVDFLPRKNAADVGQQNIKNARIWVVLWGLLGLAASFVCAIGDISILQKALFFTSLFTGPLLSIFVQAFFFPHTNPKAVIAGAVLGMLALLPFTNIPILPPGMWKPLFALAWPWNPVISVTGSLISSQLISLLLPKWRPAPAVQV
ncbi:MAG: sodium:solute symporter family protein [Fibrobacteres bacterium]|nr:sodium:solute symporter family protein [Fibrobacterota bacterium]